MRYGWLHSNETYVSLKSFSILRAITFIALTTSGSKSVPDRIEIQSIACLCECVVPYDFTDRKES